MRSGWPADFDGDGARGVSDHDPQMARFRSRAQLSVTNVAVAEGNSGTRPMTFTVKVSRPLSQTVVVCATALLVFGLPFVRLADPVGIGTITNDG